MEKVNNEKFFEASLDVKLEFWRYIFSGISKPFCAGNFRISSLVPLSLDKIVFM